MVALNEITYISLTLGPQGTSDLNKGKEKSGIQANSDFIRHLIAQYVKDEK